MTFIEIVVAFALLGIVAAAMFGMMSFATGMQVRGQRMLACAEVANRLMLKYLDDSTTMPTEPKVQVYGPDNAPAKFRWEYHEDPIQLVEANADARDQTRASTLPTDRFLQVTFKVWLSEESGGARFPDESTPCITLTRMLDPLYPRNPDSFMSMLQNPQGFQNFMNQMMGFNGATTRGNQLGQNGQGNQRGQRGNRAQFGNGGEMVNPNRAFGRGQRGIGNFGGGFRGSGNARPTGLGGVVPIGNSRPGGRGS
jgi:type II secretory pathway pseudopilin PulG